MPNLDVLLAKLKDLYQKGLNCKRIFCNVLYVQPTLQALEKDGQEYPQTPATQSTRGDEWSLRAFASMPSTAISLRARAEIKNLLCELASNAKIWGARAREHSFKFCEQIEQR